MDGASEATGQCNRRLLLVHAHPDDESITTGGTIARYVREGAEVTVLTCLLGEEGEVIGPEWAELVADRADQLGGYRIKELSTALSELGVGRPRFLVAPGRWRDSGMAGTPAAANPRAFVNADPAEAIAGILAVIRSVRPQVVVCYDEVGGYGHPDHIQVHRFTTAAVEAAGADAPAKLYWTVTDHDALNAGIARIGTLPAGWRMPEQGELPTFPSESVTTVLDISEVMDAKLAALRAHATQVTVAPTGTEFALSNNIAQPVLAEEHYVLARGQLGPLGADGLEHDLFAGL